MKTKTNNAMGGANASKKLMAAIAVLAVAFVVLAAVPAVDATGTSTTGTEPTWPNNATAVTGVEAVNPDEHGGVTLSADAKWILSADITIKSLNLAGHSLFITTADDTAKKTLTIENDEDASLIVGGTGSKFLKLDNANLVVKSTAPTKTHNTMDLSGGAFYLQANNANIDLVQTGVAGSSDGGSKLICPGDAKDGNGTVFDLTKTDMTIESPTGIQVVYFKLNESDVVCQYPDGSAATGTFNGYLDVGDKSSFTSPKTQIYSAVIAEGAELDVEDAYMLAKTGDVTQFWNNSSMAFGETKVNGTMNISGKFVGT